MRGDALLAVEDLTVEFRSRTGIVRAVDGVSFCIPRGKVVALVGQSGSGKTVTALSLLRLVPAPGRIVAGSVVCDGRDLLRIPVDELRAFRGRRIAMIFQDPLPALHPAMRVGMQVAEAYRAHRRAALDEARRAAGGFLSLVGLPSERDAAGAYPHELSSGERQRALIAMALAGGADLLVADEPTTALDATLRRDILDRLLQLCRERGLAILLITHDLGIVAGAADDVLVMREGRIVESGPASELLCRPRHPHTAHLIEAARSLERDPPQPSTVGKPLLQLESISKRFASPPIQALDDVSLSVREAEVMALVGEFGSGKTTLAKVALRLLEPTAGRVLFGTTDLTRLSVRSLRPLRRHIQMIFADAAAALDPRRSALSAAAESLDALGIGSRGERQGRAAAALDEVQLSRDAATRRPHQLSGGQRQRVGLARALAPGPRLVIADEPVSSLDVSTQAQLIELLLDLQRRERLALLLISHDLRVVRRIANRVAVMYRGRIVELSPAAELYRDALHPYTQALLSAIPTLDPQRGSFAGFPPKPSGMAAPTAGCPFQPRCPVTDKPQACFDERPRLREVRPGRSVACHVAR